MEKSEIEEHRQILPGGLSVFILFAGRKKNGFRNRNYLKNNTTADFFRLRVTPPSAQHVILTPTVPSRGLVPANQSNFLGQLSRMFLRVTRMFLRVTRMFLRKLGQTRMYFGKTRMFSNI